MKTTTQIFLAEDDPDDAYIFKLAFEKTYPSCQITVYNNGDDLLEAIQTNLTLPTYIFLDIAMPEMDGLSTLKKLKEGVQTARIPTFVLSGLNDRANIRKSYQLGANAYFVKPKTFSEHLDLAQTFNSYWTKVIHSSTI